MQHEEHECMVTIRVPGPPQGKGRARRSANGGMFTPARTRSYESLIAGMAMDAMATTGHPPFGREVPLRVTIAALMPVPASWSKRKQAAALDGLLRPIGKPDADNLAKTLDGLNGIVWHDDAAVVELAVSKRYAAMPALVIEVQAA
jgi:Holliday junction resolvase RusA-like endonuclease